MGIKATVEAYGKQNNQKELKDNLIEVRKKVESIINNNNNNNNKITTSKLQELSKELEKTITLGAGNATIGEVKIKDLKLFIDGAMNLQDNEITCKTLRTIVGMLEFNPEEYGYNNFNINNY